VREEIPNGLSRRARPAAVSGLPLWSSTHGDSASETRSATRSAVVMRSLPRSLNVRRMSSSSRTPSESSAWASPLDTVIDARPSKVGDACRGVVVLGGEHRTLTRALRRAGPMCPRESAVPRLLRTRRDVDRSGARRRSGTPRTTHGCSGEDRCNSGRRQLRGTRHGRARARPGSRAGHRGASWSPTAASPYSGIGSGRSAR